jgi:Mg2+-importing ATPase
MGVLATLFTHPLRLGGLGRSETVRVSPRLIASAQSSAAAVLKQLNTTANGLSVDEAEARLAQYGCNEVAKEKRQSWFARLANNVRNPLVILLLVLALVSFLTGDMRATIVMLSMVVLGVALRYVQETRADTAAEKLKAMVRTTATVLRGGQKREISLHDLVPGDVVILSAGDMVPADIRVLSAKDLFVNQAALTGESMPVEKWAAVESATGRSPLELSNVGFLGSNVESGTATAVVVNTGRETYLGSLASSIVGQRVETSFDKGVNGFTWLMIRFMMIMVPMVFLANGLSKGDWVQAFLFGLAVAVGLTPEMLPMIVTVNLSKGALAMSRKKVVVKRLNSIQNFGAMDVLCTDKTGTITEGRIVLEKHLDVSGHQSERILDYAYLNSFYQTGLKNLMDVAVLERADLQGRMALGGHYQKVDEVPFDFSRKRMSVVVADDSGRHILICKGAVEEIFAISTHVEVHGEVLERAPEFDTRRQELVRSLNAEGFRVIALAYKELPSPCCPDGSPASYAYSVRDEAGLTLLGFLAFLDPPKATAPEALAKLAAHNVDVRILTGDSEVVTLTICREVGLNVKRVLLGPAIEAMSDGELAGAVEDTTVFAKLSPAHKERIIHALQARGHVVGFMGDGINDAPALRAADVGISVDTAVDIAKESSDIILLENSLLVLEEGVIEGRKVFGNIIKYIRMAASSNFGNMFSVLGGSIILPFLPMLPIQVLTNNLLYDFSQTAIPTDQVDASWLAIPRKWAIDDIQRYIIFIGPISSIFDYVTYFIMLHVFNSWHNPALFHTGWFVESVFTQTLIIHVIRTNRIPFLQSRASWPMIFTSVAVVLVAAWLPVSPLAGALGLVSLPALFWPLLAAMLLAYVGLTQIVKTWFNRRFHPEEPAISGAGSSLVPVPSATAS